MCDLCKKEFAINVILQRSVRYQDTIFNNELKRAELCYSCGEEIRQLPEHYICKFKGCRVLKQENRNYCIRHDENSPPIKFESPTIKTWDND